MKDKQSLNRQQLRSMSSDLNPGDKKTHLNHGDTSLRSEWQRIDVVKSNKNRRFSDENSLFKENFCSESVLLTTYATTHKCHSREKRGIPNHLTGILLRPNYGCRRDSAQGEALHRKAW